ncbi:MAG: choice-of-anchor V domain-containing protein [Bacteroidota bacterium]|nr:choice-of-anchor V domain-containing protein [Bacteroidota bacterium]
MKKIIFPTFIILTGIIILESFGTIQPRQKDGTEPGYTGSPGDSLKNCTVCHGGKATTVSNWIESNIPTEGYTPGATYTITATNTESGGTRFGFEVSPQNISGDLLGKIVITDTTRTKLVGNNKYITYTKYGVDGIGKLSWKFDWVAPSANTGDVVFYGAFNSNFEGHKDSDQTFLSTLKVNEKNPLAIAEKESKLNSFKVYPNPATDLVSISMDLKETSNLLIDVTDITGKQVAIISNEKQSAGALTTQFNTTILPSGNYFVRISVNGKTATQKLSIAH